MKPGILLQNPNFEAFKEEGGFIKNPEGIDPYVDRWWGGDGSFVDFTNPKGRKVWK